jgi:hypothetical protein
VRRRAALVAVLGLVLVAAKGASSTLPYSGPLGLRWGKSPADARSILANKLTFVTETPGDLNSYNTIDQRYAGSFAGLPIAEAILKFHRGEFFYLGVILQTAEAKSATRVFERVVAKMRKTYGPPRKETRPPRLASGKSISDHVPLADKRPWVLPLLWNEQTRADEEKLYQLHDLNIRTGLWDPFAGWRFPNGVTIQVFVHLERLKLGERGLLKPIWIFAKEDRIKKWLQDVHVQNWIPPRDF